MWEEAAQVYAFLHVSSIPAQPQYIYAHFLNSEICSLWFYHAHVIAKIKTVHTE